jgi:gluconate:H+ symporter, GntP family
MFATIAAAAQPSGSLWPFVVLVTSVAFVILAISVLRIHAFVALIAAALLAGILSERLPDEAGNSKALHCVRAMELTTIEFGKTAGAIGIAIALACVIAVCLMESGAADKVVRRFLAIFGEHRASFALLVSTYVLSIPIFFDTMFMLMLPLAMTLAMRTGKDYLLYVLAICAGGVVTHSMTVPHPGPMAMVDNLKVDVGLSIVAGILVGVVPAFGGWLVARRLNWKLNFALRETTGFPLADLHKSIQRPESELPGFVASIAPVIVPILLITGASLTKVLVHDPESPWNIMEFIGNKNMALLVGAVVSVALLARAKKLRMQQIADLLDRPLQTAGVAILITSAGGAFGLMLKNAGVGDAIQSLMKDHQINLVFLSFVIAAVLRIAQGSATVAMLATSSIIYPLMQTGLPHHPIYLFLSIGFGAMSVSWMNDSGFWIVSKLTGFTERETLASWTVLLATISAIGLVTTLILSLVLPLK